MVVSDDAPVASVASVAASVAGTSALLPQDLGGPAQRRRRPLMPVQALGPAGPQKASGSLKETAGAPRLEDGP